jgi:hypothetical protein
MNCESLRQMEVKEFRHWGRRKLGGPLFCKDVQFSI